MLTHLDDLTALEDNLFFSGSFGVAEMSLCDRRLSKLLLFASLFLALLMKIPLRVLGRKICGKNQTS